MSQNADTLITETPTPAPPVVEPATPATPATAPQPAAPHIRLQRDLGNAAIVRSLIQRKAEDTNPTPPATPATPAAPAQTLAPRIVDDKADAAPGQMRKTEFLTQLRTSVCNAAADAFRGTRWSEEGCPYIERVFAYCAMLDSERLERGFRRYAPETASVATAAELIPIITARVRSSLTTFVSTGQVTGVPPGVPVDVSGGALGMLGGGVSAVTSLLFKEHKGSQAKHDADPQTIQTQLGAGTQLDDGVRSRMESAYGETFSDVEVHADTNAAGLSKDLNARAFTVGQHIAFGNGEYRPGTLIGDALIAHELAHVMQQRRGDKTAAPAQKGTTDHDSFEEEADHAAVDAVVSTWGGARKGLAKLGNRAMTGLRSSLRLQRCKSDVAIPAEYQMPPTVGPQDEELMQRLEGRHDVYAKYQAYLSAVKNDARLSSCGASNPQALGASLGNIGRLNDMRRDLDAELREEGFASIEDFEAKIKQFDAFFERYAIQAAFQILQENEALIQAESKRYGGPASSSGITELKAALAPAKATVDQADRIPPVAKTETDGLGKAVVYYPAPEAVRLWEEAEQMGRALAPRFPILADPNVSIRALVSADDAKVQSILQSTASDRVSDIQKTRQNLVDKPSLVWQMEVAVERARTQLKIVQGSIYDALIRNKLSDIQWDKTFRSLVIGALAIGLGVISAGTGTAAVLAGAALAGVSIGTLTAHTKEYLIQQAAAGTAFDRAKALTSIEPSLGWLALDVVAAVLDVGAAVSAFRALSGTAKAAAEGAATINDLRQKALTVGEQLAKEKQIADAKAFADRIAAAAERAQQGKKLLAGSPEAANAIRAAAKGLDDTAVTGLLRLSPEARAIVLTKFAGNAEVLTRLGALAEQSEHVVTAVNLLKRNLSEKQFEVILGHYLKTRDIDSVAKMLRAIGEAGVDDAAIKAIAASMGKVKTEGGVIRKFTPQIHEAIAEKLGPGHEGIKKLLSVTEGLHPNQSGTIFEEWAAKYVYGGTREKAVFDTSKLKGPYSRNPMSSDNWGSSGKVVDFKHLRSGEKFSGSSVSQLEDYAALIRDGATFKGTRVTSVEYLFSTLEAAQANAAKIRGTLLENVTIKYIDSATGLPVVLP